MQWLTAKGFGCCPSLTPALCRAMPCRCYCYCTPKTCQRGSQPALLCRLYRLQPAGSPGFAHGDVGGGGRHNVKDTMPTDSTGTKRGRTKKQERERPPKKLTQAAHPQPNIDVLSRCNRNCVTVTANKLANLPI